MGRLGAPSPSVVALLQIAQAGGHAHERGEDDLIVEPIQFQDGYTPTPMAPGLGCELDMAAVARYAQHFEQIEP